MASKKTPVTEETEQEVKTAEEPARDLKAEMQAEIERLKAENEQLKKNSIAANSPYGSKTDYERVQDACREVAENGGDPWAVKITIRAPRRPSREDPFYWMSINGRTIQIPATDRGYEMALPFAETLVNMIAAENAASDYIDNLEVKDPETNPHKE